MKRLGKFYAQAITVEFGDFDVLFGPPIYETMPILTAQSDADIIGLIISVDRMEKGKTENRL